MSSQPDLKQLILLNAFIGGYMGKSFAVSMDREEKGIHHMTYYRGDVLELNENDFTDEDPQFTNESWQKFIEDLHQIDILKWKANYENHTIIDGTQWNLELLFEDGSKIKKRGINSFPRTFSKFSKIIENLTGKEFV